MRAAAAVLAAGLGTRFGGTKQLADLDGRPLVCHAVDTAVRAGLAPVLVITGHDARAVADVLPDEATAIPNPWYSEGQATSLHMAVEAASSTDAGVLVVLLGDEPCVDPDVVRAVLGACEAGASVARAVYDDRPGHPVAFTRGVWQQLLGASGDDGARGLLADLEVTEVRVHGPGPRDVDTTEDLADLGR